MRLAWFGLAAALVWGCAPVPPPLSQPPSAEARTPGAHRVAAVPFYPQEAYACGPATLASVLAFWGKPIPVERITQELAVPNLKLRGTLTIDMARYASAQGFAAETFEGTLDDLRRELVAGHPLIVMLNLGSRFFPVPHYAVAIGFDDGRQVVFLHSGRTPDHPVPYKKFLRDWRKTDHWTLRVLPAGLARR